VVTSDESGAFEAYVRSYPEPTVKLQVSLGGGFGLSWSSDSKRLYYGIGRVIVEVKLATTPTLHVVSRDTVFTQVPYDLGFDISRDGQRLVFLRTQSTAYPLVVVPNWRTELRERMATNRK
jgi:hypothetical protein